MYQGYKEITGDSNFINDYLYGFDAKDWSVNEYLVINNADDDSVKEMRFDGEKFVPLRLPSSKYVKAKNALQRCALDLMLNPAITVVALLGGPGSGKTFLSMRMGQYHVSEKGTHAKMLGVREPRGEGKEVGFLPGELANKTGFFFAPLAQQLDGGEFELKSLEMRGEIEEMIPYYMKGMTYKDTIMIVDEAEDLTAKQIRLIGTRVGENSKIFFAGDYKQSLLENSESNPLVRMCEQFKGNPMFGCVFLGDDVRSETSRLFANLNI